MGQATPDADDLRQTGRFVFHVASDAWDWDDQTYVLHGYQPGAIEPTTELIMKHKHDLDRDRVARQFADAADNGEPFTIYYRIVVDDEIRHVVLVGAGEYDAASPRGGRADRLVGYYLDLTPEMEAAESAAADAAVAASAASRDTIEQAKGVLMLAYGLDPHAAFALLKWWSRSRNVKVREIAEWLVQSAGGGNMSHPDLRHLLDALIDDLTATRAS